MGQTDLKKVKMKPTRMFLLKCPKCGNSMKYQSAGSITSISKKRKQCVYCGSSFKVSDHIINQIK